MRPRMERHELTCKTDSLLGLYFCVGGGGRTPSVSARVRRQLPREGAFGRSRGLTFSLRMVSYCCKRDDESLPLEGGGFTRGLKSRERRRREFVLPTKTAPIPKDWSCKSSEIISGIRAIWFVEMKRIGPAKLLQQGRWLLRKSDVVQILNEILFGEAKPDGAAGEYRAIAGSLRGVLHPIAKTVGPFIQVGSYLIWHGIDPYRPICAQKNMFHAGFLIHSPT